jgi:hypothetical protein
MPASQVTRPLLMAGSVIPQDALVIHTTGGVRLVSIAEVAVLGRLAAQAVMPMNA